MRRSKILATVGPASKDKIDDLITAGANSFRLNFSHGDHAFHAANFKTIRAAAEKSGRYIPILQDLQGPKIRLGVFGCDEPVFLKEGQQFILDSDETPGDETRCHLPHPEILNVLKVDDLVYFNDGTVRTKVSDKNADAVTLIVTGSGLVSSRKGVNLPGVDLPISALTDKDWQDLDFGLSLGVDWVAVSFVQSEMDVLAVKQKTAGKACVMAKIELPNAVERIDAIIDAADGIMIARGDLGVEVPIEEVPSIQKRIIRKCREKGKPVVVATQMLESMIHHGYPTRAEVSDVANASFEGADVLMLSAETAAGDFPIEAVSTMRRAIERTEASSAWRPLMDARHFVPEKTVSDAITYAAYHTAETVDAAAIVCFTSSGATAQRMSRQRPIQPILAFTPCKNVAKQLSLLWGMTCYVGAQPENQEHLVTLALEGVAQTRLAKPGELVVLTAGLPFGQTGSTNLLRVVVQN